MRCPIKIANDRKARRNPDPHCGDMAANRSPLGSRRARQRPHDFKRRSHGALGIVLMGIRIAEIDQDAVPDITGGKTLVLIHHTDASLPEARDDIAYIFGIELLGQ